MTEHKASLNSFHTDFKHIFRLAGPAIATQLLQTGVLYVDRFMLGHYSSTALAAMQIAGPIEWTLMTVPTAFTIGTFILVGHAKGAKDTFTAQRHTRLALLFALVVSAFIIGIGLLIVLSLSRIFPVASHETLSSASDYLHLGLLATPFFCIGTAGFAALSASGDTITPFKIGLSVNIVHVLINYCLIQGQYGFPALGLRGAGISMVVSFALEAMLTLRALLHKRTQTSSFTLIYPWVWPLHGTEGRLALRSLFKLSTPAFFERIVYHSGYMIFVWMIARLGDDAMAANQALVTIEAISYNCIEGLPPHQELWLHNH